MRRTLATGSKGFTLIEVLVVVAITGIVIALAVPNLFPSDAEVARRASGDVALAIEGARDAAWFGGRPMSVTIEEGTVRAWRYSGGEWRADSGRERSCGGSQGREPPRASDGWITPGSRRRWRPGWPGRWPA